MNNSLAILFANSYSAKEVFFQRIIERELAVCKFTGISNILVVCTDASLFNELSTREDIAYCIYTGNDTNSSILDLKIVSDFLLENGNKYENVLVVPEPLPFMRAKPLQKLFSLKSHKRACCTALVPIQCNRYILNEQNTILCDTQMIVDFLSTSKSLTTGKIQKMCHKLDKKIIYHKAKTPYDTYSPCLSDPTSLFTMVQQYQKDYIHSLIEHGVNFINTDGIIIDPNVTIGEGTTILPNTIIKGTTKIGKNCVIGPNSLISNCNIEESVEINASQCYNSIVHDFVKIGPFCHVRPNSVLKKGVKLGDFVEVKNSTIGEKTSISHLTYIGDSDVGERVNFGCGVVTVNYDGTNKNRCTIGDDAFIGCNTNLVAPVTVGNGGYVAAGSTITEAVPADALAIARQRQTNKEGYAIGRVKKK